MCKNTSSVEYLLKIGAKPTRELIEQALKVNDLKIAILLQSKYGHVNELYSGNTLLYYAVKQYDLDSAYQLILRGAKPTEHIDGISIITRIMRLASDGTFNEENDFRGDKALKILQELINRHLFSLTNVWKQLLVSCGGSYSKLIKFLVKNGANPNATFVVNDCNGCRQGNWTPLHMSIFKQNPDNIKALLSCGANINLKTSLIVNIQLPNKLLKIYEMQTPLSLAIELTNWPQRGMHFQTIVELLLKSGAKL